jgi:heterodisulfide reductase subunit A
LPVTLVEQGPAIGGLMAQLDKTFPTNDCAMCILSPKMLEIARHPQIDILTLTQILQVQGGPGDFQVLLHRRPRYVEVEKCSACGECVRVCPRKIPDPYNLGLTLTKAIHIPFPQAIPQAAYIVPEVCRHLQGKKAKACFEVCKAGAINFNQVPETWVTAAGAIILAPGARPVWPTEFSGFGHPDVVTSLAFERLLSATGPHGGRLLRPSDQTPPRSIAFLQCVGSRDPQSGASYCSATCCMASLKEALVALELSPAPLEAAMFYMDIRAQGKGFERYLEQARQRQVELVPSRVTAVQPLPQGGIGVRYTDTHGHPQERAFDLAVLAVGMRPAAELPEWAGRLKLKLNEHGFIATQALTPVCTSREGVFVCGTAQEPMDIPEAVTTAGAAAGAVSALLTVGTRSWPSPGSWPAGTSTPPAAPKIGVFLCHCGTNIAKTIDLEALAETARHQPGVVHVERYPFSCSVESTRKMAAAIRDLGLTQVVVAACTPRTHEPVFREVLAAAGLNPGYLAFANIREQCSWVHQGNPQAALGKAKDLVSIAINRARFLKPLQRQGFPVIPRALVLGAGVAGMSAALSLAHQGFHTYVVERSPHLGGLARQLRYTLEGQDPQLLLRELKTAIFHHPNVEILRHTELVKVEGHVGRFRSTVLQKQQEFQADRRLLHGVIVVATGGKVFEPQGRYLYGDNPRILTQRELEERLFQGSPQLSQVRQVVMIQCVGSREPEHPYCSRLCCSEALKNAMIVKECQPLAEVTILYRDLRAYGFKEGYYQQAKEKGIRFIPFTADQPPRLTLGPRRRLLVAVRDRLLEKEVGLRADLVVLSTGIEPAEGVEQVSRQLGVPQTSEGFLLEAHQKLRPVDTVTEGVFLCGLAHYPKTLGETVAQAQAAASRAAGVLFQAELLSGDLYALINPGRCSRCLSCVEVCPYKAIQVGPGGRPKVIMEVCRGCGVCAAGCPAQAIDLSCFSQDEVVAQIDAALQEPAG